MDETRTELGDAVEALRAAEGRVLDVTRRSMRALLEGGFVFHDFADPNRARIHAEIIAEGVTYTPATDEARP